MIPRFGFAAAVLLLTAAALCFRLPSLNNRPMHGDEAVHALKFKDILERGVYHYDPNEYHGPTLYYPALLSVDLRGRDRFADTQEADYRIVTALFGAALIPLLFLMRDAMGRHAALWAALFAALSPAFVFYSRYYIQEMLLVFFTLGAIGCVWRYRRSGAAGWLAAGGAFAGLMIATKETAVLAFLAMGIAWLFARWGLNRPANPESGRAGSRRLGRGALFVSAAVITAYLFLSGFFSDPAGPLRYLESYVIWVKRAVTPNAESAGLAGAGIHNQPWSYYLSMLLWTHRAKGPVWSEALILALAVIGIAAAFWKGISTRAVYSGLSEPAPDEFDPGFARFIAIYTFALTAMYCAIPYKTPWSMLGFLHGMTLLAGLGAAAVVKWIPIAAGRAAAAAALLALSVQLGWQAYRTSFVFPTDGRNPYAYAQPVPDVVEMGKRVEDLARAHQLKDKMPVRVYSVDAYYWPIPWYLRRLENVGYWTGLPEETEGPVILASPEFDEELTKRLGVTHLMTGFYGLRPSVLMMVWVRMDLWEPYIKSRPRPPE